MRCETSGCAKPAMHAQVRDGDGWAWACTEHAVLPSARALLQAGVAVREVGVKRGWSVYGEATGPWTYYPGDEGPQEAASLDEVLDWIGGDQPVLLAPAGRVKWALLDKATQERLIDGCCLPATPPPAPDASASFPPDTDKLVQARVLNQAARILSARGCTSLAASLRDECDSVLRELL